MNHFKYLGSVISEDGYCENDVRCRIAKAKNAFMEKKKLLLSKLNMDLKKRIVCKEHHLECCTVCSRDMDTDRNLKKEARSF